MGMYCKTCGYDIGHCESRTCPECGRAFDPGNRWSYFRRPWQIIHPIRTPILALAMLCLLGTWLVIDDPLHLYPCVTYPTLSAISAQQTLSSQFELYKYQHGKQFPTLTQLQNDWTVLTGETHGNNGELVGPYLQRAPVNPITDSSSVAAVGRGTPDDGWEYDEKTGRIWFIVPSQEIFDEHDIDHHVGIVRESDR